MNRKIQSEFVENDQIKLIHEKLSQSLIKPNNLIEKSFNKMPALLLLRHISTSKMFFDLHKQQMPYKWIESFNFYEIFLKRSSYWPLVNRPTYLLDYTMRKTDFSNLKFLILSLKSFASRHIFLIIQKKPIFNLIF